MGRTMTLKTKEGLPRLSRSNGLVSSATSPLNQLVLIQMNLLNRLVTCSPSPCPQPRPLPLI